MQFYKRVLLIIAQVILIVSFTACNGSKDKSTLTVGFDDTYPPMEFVNTKYELIGFDVDVAKAVANKLNMEFRHVTSSQEGIFLSLITDKFDCIISSVSITELRKQQFLFSKPYLANGQVIIVSKRNHYITKPEELLNKNVGVQTSTTSQAAAEKYQKITPFRLVKYDQMVQTFSDLKVGRLDAIVADEVVARYYAKIYPDDLRVIDIKLSNEPMGICFKKTSVELRDKVQKALEELKDNGTLRMLSEKWFDVDLTSNLD